MERALSAYRNGDMGLNEAARTYQVPKATLSRHLNGNNIKAIEHTQHFGRGADLPQEIEDDLVQHILLLEERFFGLTRNDLRRLAFQLAEANEINHRFSKDKKMAGDKWYYSFITRHPEISLRQPEATSMARAKGFSKDQVKKFFDVLTVIVDENKLDGTVIFNMDETALSTVQKPQKVLAKRGKHQVGAITSGERGTNTTGICCMSAAGMFVPPMLIFRRLRFKDELTRGAPVGCQFACTESGWITTEVFLKWLEHFVATIGPTPDKKVLLILDGHTTHTKNIAAIEFARKNGVILLSLPAHTTHRLQPLDVSFFKPLSVYYNQACDKWLRTNPGKTITQFQVSEIFGEAYGRAASIVTATNGFSKTGIWPVDPNVFADSDFVTILEQREGEVVEKNQSEPSLSSTLDCEVGLGLNTSSDATAKEIISPPRSVKFKKAGDISPLPSCCVGNTRKRNPSGVAVLTSSPYKNDLLAKKQSATPSCSKEVIFETSGTKPDESWFCGVCATTAVREMIQCMRCRKWSHVDCAKVKPRAKKYFCDSCK